MTVNEEREQTKTILENQREEETLEGVLKRKKKEGIITFHQNIQRLILPLAVVNLCQRTQVSGHKTTNETGSKEVSNFNKNNSTDTPISKGSAYSEGRKWKRSGLYRSGEE
ncbi:hypothetical protein LEP1GSC131_1632 [Leptospira kirschneri str. 200802841]|uniref:Uncharacterized protein n=1 Tax=Leptospira kirschneri str. 200802841 TaxID=1193047 RepID=A0A828Y887_9LEPT|nr:hypothetical protein LEP1GSC131_1632 [Leptospira kirschneri str. 200802841]